MTKLRHRLSDFTRQVRLLGRPGHAAAVGRLFGLLRQPKYRPGMITWQGHRLRYADAPALYYQLSDIYVERVYDFTCERADPRILDVGGHIGLASLRFRELFPAARISTFEPDPAHLDLLRANLAEANDTSTEVVAAAAWTSDGKRAFAATGDDSGALAETGGLQVATVDLARFCTEPVDLLKLDVEGAEFELIDHLSASGALERVQRLFVEMHEWNSGSPRFHELIARLVKAGFNYRIRSAAAMGAAPNPAGFTALAHAANLVALYAWRN